MTKREHLDKAREVARTINHCQKKNRAWRVRQWAQHVRNMLAEAPQQLHKLQARPNDVGAAKKRNAA